MNMKLGGLIIIALTVSILVGQSALFAADQSPLLEAMKTELDRSFVGLRNAADAPLYYLAYQATDTEKHSISASYGAIKEEDKSRRRILDIDCRVGDHRLDNTHEIRGGLSYGFTEDVSGPLGLEDDAIAIRTVIWRHTDEAYKNALERYTKVITNQQVLVDKEDTSADFSFEKPEVYIGETAAAALDTDAWKGRLRIWSSIFKAYPFVETSEVEVLLTNDNRYFVDSDGAMIQSGQSYARLALRCSGTADDGMKLRRYHNFDSDLPSDLPTDERVEEAIRRLIDELAELLKAPMAEPYAGPAILVNRASGVFFHEIFGHRIEGHRQKSESEGQTFARKIGQQVLPDFISVYDDPTLERLDGTFLRGHYKYDDEGVRARRVAVVENGVMENFLMSRSPVAGFPNSNGHGRKEAGNSAVARQGNLIVESSKEYSFDTLLSMLVEECRRQGKPYGLVFHDISGGFTITGRYLPQSFKVLPLLVYRYYADGRPPEAIRGVDIVGTPLSSFEKIIATGDDYDVFNGTCNAESGSIPVSAVSPSILVSQLEVEKRAKGQDRPPVLGPPYSPGGTDTAWPEMQR
jgi:predicted Zn-dependent protease